MKSFMSIKKMATIFEFFIACAKLHQVAPFPWTNLVGYDILQADLMSEIEDTKYSIIPADDMQSHKVKQLPICIRFVDKNNNIRREEFLQFSRCEKING